MHARLYERAGSYGFYAHFEMAEPVVDKSIMRFWSDCGKTDTRGTMGQIARGGPFFGRNRASVSGPKVIILIRIDLASIGRRDSLNLEQSMHDD